MIITKEFVDQYFPNHYSNCSDEDLCDDDGGEITFGDGYTPCYPDCSRCYLLRHLGSKSEDLDFRPVIGDGDNWLSYRYGYDC